MDTLGIKIYIGFLVYIILGILLEALIEHYADKIKFRKPSSFMVAVFVVFWPFFVLYFLIVFFRALFRFILRKNDEK
jgi:chromate transport protein ChrA